MDCEMTDIIAIISSIIAVGYSIYSIVTKGYIRQYNLKNLSIFFKSEESLYCFQFIMTLIIGISGFIYCYYTFLMGLKTLLC